jgi:hypothetical protein
MRVKFKVLQWGADRLNACGQAGRQAGKQASRQAGKQASKQAGRQAGRQFRHGILRLIIRRRNEKFAMSCRVRLEVYSLSAKFGVLELSNSTGRDLAPNSSEICPIISRSGPPPHHLICIFSKSFYTRAQTICAAWLLRIAQFRFPMNFLTAFGSQPMNEQQRTKNES